MASYATEREGQIEFYETFIPRVDPDLDLDGILADDNDGVINGNLLEFKLRVIDLNAVLFQCVKYLSNASSTSPPADLRESRFLRTW